MSYSTLVSCAQLASQRRAFDVQHINDGFELVISLRHGGRIERARLENVGAVDQGAAKRGQGIFRTRHAVAAVSHEVGLKSVRDDKRI